MKTLSSNIKARKLLVFCGNAKPNTTWYKSFFLGFSTFLVCVGHLLSNYKPLDCFCCSICWVFLAADYKHSDLPGNCGFPKLPKIRQKQMISRAVIFLLSSVCGWHVTLDSHHMPLWEAGEAWPQSSHSYKRTRAQTSNFACVISSYTDSDILV